MHHINLDQILYNPWHMTVFSHLFCPRWTALESSKLHLFLWIHLKFYVCLLLRRPVIKYFILCNLEQIWQCGSIFSQNCVYDLLQSCHHLVICKTNANSFTTCMMKLFAHIDDWMHCQTMPRQASTHILT